MTTRAWIVDLAMTAILPLLMAYSLVGEALHEVLGVVMFALFVAHQAIHWWYFRYFRSGLKLRHLPSNTINIVLIVLMILVPVSGLFMSSTVTPWLAGLVGNAALWMRIHMVGAYWAFVLMSIHAGMHAASARKNVRERLNLKEPVPGSGRLEPIHVALPFLGAAAAWGAIRFVQHGIPGYLVGKVAFAFFGASLGQFLVDYAAIGIFLAAIGWALHAGWEKLTVRPRS